ncbi:MAG: 3-phosphoshikimate 1-carboxyvinyltransferase, partial [Deferribacteraceae bacterium]|nr:3-phosphoshikimate 1-carboxyvinyltransferase [Deferribacteraceae bacterium]
GITIEGSLKAGVYELDGNVSSQFISGLLFALPLLQGDSIIKIKPPLESLSYIKLTLSALARFGIEVENNDPFTYHIRGGQEYCPANYTVEGDYSQFAFMAVLGAINGDIACAGMDSASLQGDKAILDTLARSGAAIKGFHAQKSSLIATDTDLADCPDLGPILCTLAMYSKGTSRIYNAGRLRYKESDRIDSMQQELRKLGVMMETTADEIIITGQESYAGGVVLDGHNDHRIVMSLAVAAALCKESIVIEGAEAVNKSYPNFFDDLKALGADVKLI